MRYSTISRCYFAEYNWDTYKISKRTNRAIVMLVKYFVSPRSRCSRRPGLHIRSFGSTNLIKRLLQRPLSVLNHDKVARWHRCQERLWLFTLQSPCHASVLIKRKLLFMSKISHTDIINLDFTYEDDFVWQKINSLAKQGHRLFPRKIM